MIYSTATVPTWLKKAAARRGPSTHGRTNESVLSGVIILNLGDVVSII
jgi:hypothetical protein